MQWIVDLGVCAIGFTWVVKFVSFLMSERSGDSGRYKHWTEE